MPDYTPNSTIIEREDLSPELSIFRIACDSGKAPEFQPGQYAELGMPIEALTDSPEVIANNKKFIRRAYSIASAPDTRDYLEFYIVLVPDGLLTPLFWNPSFDGRIWLGPKIKGKFVIDPAPSKANLVMFATGTGLAPFLSMLREFRGQNRWQRFTIIHGARREAELGYRKELEQLQAEDSSIFYIPTLTREPKDSTWSGHRGRVQHIIESDIYEKTVGVPLASENTHVFLCGNPGMIDSLEEIFTSRDFRLHSKKNPGNIHLERYW